MAVAAAFVAHEEMQARMKGWREVFRRKLSEKHTIMYHVNGWVERQEAAAFKVEFPGEFLEDRAALQAVQAVAVAVAVVVAAAVQR